MPQFRTLKANENKIFFDGMEELYKLIQGADKEVGGELCVCVMELCQALLRVGSCRCYTNC